MKKGAPRRPLFHLDQMSYFVLSMKALYFS